MRQIARLLPAMIVWSVAAVYAQDRPAGTTTGEIEKAILAQEQALYQAVAKQDKASFQSLVAGDGVWTTTTGFVPVRMLADHLEVFELSTFGIENPRVTRLDANSALVIYARTAEGRFQEQPVAPTALASTVWVKRDGSWRAIHHQETDLTR